MAHKKAAGSSRNGRDSAGRRLGIKKIWRRNSYTWKYYITSKRNKISSW